MRRLALRAARAAALPRRAASAPPPRMRPPPPAAARPPPPLPSPSTWRASTTRATAVAAAPDAPLAATPTAPPSSFAAAGLGADVVAALEAMGITRPTEIQSAAIPALLAGGDVLLAARTGSGKTLAFLAPLFHRLRAAEAAAGGARLARPRRPRAIVLCPTRELTDQTLRVAKALARGGAPLAVAGADATGGLREQAAALARGADVLVATPARVATLKEGGSLALGDVEVVVLDEADTLFDGGFAGEVKPLLAALRGKAGPADVVLVAATAPSAAARAWAAAVGPSLRRVEAAGLHTPPPTAKHEFVPAGAEDRVTLLLDAAARATARGGRAIVFCGTVPSARAVGHALTEAGFDAACVHGDVPTEARAAELARFCAWRRDGDDGGPPPSSSRRPRGPLLVATDVAARGLDVPGGVDAVINFDFPRSAVDYTHRAGRTARAGAAGLVVSLVAGHDRVLAGRIRDAVARGVSLDGLSRRKEDAPAHMAPSAATRARREEEAAAARAARRGRRGAARFEEGGDGRGGGGGGGGRGGGGKPRQRSLKR